MSRQSKQKRGRYGDGCLYLRGKTWWIKYSEPTRLPDGTIKTKQKFESTHSEDKKFAQGVLRAKLVQVGGRRPLAFDPKKVTYEDVRDNYLADRVAKGMRSVKFRDDKPNIGTFSRLDKFFGGRFAVDITIADLKRFRRETKADGVTDATVNRHMATIRAMLRQAVKDEKLTSSEVPGYFPMVNEPNEARGAIFIDSKFYAPLRKKLSEPLRSAFTLAYHTGIRVHEMRRLRWRDVDLSKGTIAIPGESTKTGVSRTIFIPRDFDRKAGKPDEKVFPMGDGRLSWYLPCASVGAGFLECRECHARCSGQICPTHGFRRAHALKYYGILLRHTRHTAVRNMVEAGLDRTRAKQISGHMTDSMFNRYNIGREKDVAFAREAIERFHSSSRRNL